MNKIWIVLFALMLASCDKDKTLDNALDGEWVLTNVTCFCFYGEDYDFTQNNMVIEVEQNTLTIFNADEDLFFLARNGSYDINVNKNIITVDNDRQYTYRLEGDNTLILEYIDVLEIADDEVTFTYKRR